MNSTSPEINYEERYIDLLRAHTKLTSDYDRIHKYVLYLNNKRREPRIETSWAPVEKDINASLHPTNKYVNDNDD
tara:strand:+ start:908 stop:1132 length:225 start_codon:yes stop_codon:yes gene_type:complete